MSRKAVAGFLAADSFRDTWQHNMGSDTPLCLAATPTPLLPYEVALLPLPLPPLPRTLCLLTFWCQLLVDQTSNAGATNN